MLVGKVEIFRNIHLLLNKKITAKYHLIILKLLIRNRIKMLSMLSTSTKDTTISR